MRWCSIGDIFQVFILWSKSNSRSFSEDASWAAAYLEIEKLSTCFLKACSLSYISWISFNSCSFSLFSYSTSISCATISDRLRMGGGWDSVDEPRELLYDVIELPLRRRWLITLDGLNWNFTGYKGARGLILMGDLRGLSFLKVFFLLLLEFSLEFISCMTLFLMFYLSALNSSPIIFLHVYTFS